MAEDCVFCKIISKEIPSTPIYEDEEFLVIPDIRPSAPIHILLIPKKHLPSTAALEAADAELVGKLVILSRKIAEGQGLIDYKLIFNNGRFVEVPHLHLHLLAGM